MVIDASAIAVIASNEPDAAAFENRIAEDPVRMMSAAAVLEAAIIIETRLGAAGGSALDLWLKTLRIEIVPVDEDQTDLARRAWRQFGTGRHPASLNFGDCFSYALAMTMQEPLLFKGGGFSQTDIQAA